VTALEARARALQKKDRGLLHCSSKEEEDVIRDGSNKLRRTRERCRGRWRNWKVRYTGREASLRGAGGIGLERGHSRSTLYAASVQRANTYQGNLLPPYNMIEPLFIFAEQLKSPSDVVKKKRDGLRQN